MSTAAELLVRCLENEGVEYIFGIPGEENLHVMDALLDSAIRFITVRHEQGGAFMADVYGRLTGRAGVCLATLGPGATNLVTGVADATMDRAPVVAIAGQGATTRMHKESHQVLDLVRLFQPVSKYAAQVLEPDIVPEVIRKAFKTAQAEKPGASFISVPENIAAAPAPEGAVPLKVQAPTPPRPPQAKIEQVARLIAEARRPVIMAGNGVIRDRASAALTRFAEHCRIPVATTFMAKGAIPFSHPLSLGSIGLQSRDLVNCGFDRADLVLCVGFDMVEYHPHLWNPRRDKRIIHIDQDYAEVDAHYIVEAGVSGEIGPTLDRIAAATAPRQDDGCFTLRDHIVAELDRGSDDPAFPLKPQRILHDLRLVMEDEDILVCDVGAHKMWTARYWRCERPGTCIISNGFAAMGIALPGAIAAALVRPERRILALCGDAGFLMNVQEIETALRLGLSLVIMVWTDGAYGLIKWHQDRRFGRGGHISFNNPDLVMLAESFGARGFRVESADELIPALREAFACNTVAVVDVPVDYAENMRLTEKLGRLVCPL